MLTLSEDARLAGAIVATIVAMAAIGFGLYLRLEQVSDRLEALERWLNANAKRGGPR
jgi:hypothetical protein